MLNIKTKLPNEIYTLNIRILDRILLLHNYMSRVRLVPAVYGYITIIVGNCFVKVNLITRRYGIIVLCVKLSKQMCILCNKLFIGWYVQLKCRVRYFNYYNYYLST